MLLADAGEGVITIDMCDGLGIPTVAFIPRGSKLLIEGCIRVPNLFSSILTVSRMS